MTNILFICFIWIFYFFISLKSLESEISSIKSLEKSPEAEIYSIGSSVTLSCKLKLSSRTNVVVFRKDKNLKSEGCAVFDKDKHSIECVNITEGDDKFNIFQFTIKQISWEDRGQWDCLYLQAALSTEIKIKVNPSFEKLQIHAAPPVSAVTQTYRLMGRGSRTNPFNLRDGATVNITCLSSCSYPETIHTWSHKNSTHASVEMKHVRQKRRDLCNLETYKDMIASESEVTINCSSQKIVGANIVMCGTAGLSEMNSSSVYILCPGGERPWELTTGEIIGVAVSVGITILLVLFICILVKRSRYTNVPGDASTNTYSSGVKV